MAQEKTINTSIKSITFDTFDTSDKSNKSNVSIYLSGSNHQIETLRIVSEHLTKTGFEVNSNWIERELVNQSPSEKHTYADCNTNEIIESDYIIAIMTDPKYSYQKTFTEIGIAIGFQKNIIIVCDGNTLIDYNKVTYSHHCMTNIFYWHNSVIRVSSINEAIDILSDDKNHDDSDDDIVIDDDKINKSNSFENIAEIHSSCMR
jgi:hypothetical protein